MATSTPLEPSLSAPERTRDETVLHWGAALGALVLGTAMVAGVALLHGGRTVVVDGGIGATWDATYRFYEAAWLVAAAAVVVTAVFVHADSSRPSPLSWAALAVAVLAWVSTVPSWWEVVGREAPLPFFDVSTRLVPVWMVMAGASALAGRAWHRWLAVLTVVTGVGLLLLYWVPLVGTGMPTVWAVAFAVALVVGPHPRAAAAADPGAVTAASTPGSATISPRRTGRWYRTPSGAIRLLSGVGPPVAVAVTFLIGYATVSQGTDAPTGDTNFTWMPMGVIVVWRSRRTHRAGCPVGADRARSGDQRVTVLAEHRVAIPGGIRRGRLSRKREGDDGRPVRALAPADRHRLGMGGPQ